MRLGPNSGQFAEQRHTQATNTPSVNVCFMCVFVQTLVHLMVIQAFLRQIRLFATQLCCWPEDKTAICFGKFFFVCLFFYWLKTDHFCVNTTCSRLIRMPVSAPLVTAMCCCNVTPFTTKCWTALSDEPAPRTTKRPNYRAIYVFVRGFKWALVSRGRHIGEVRRSV